MADGCDGFTLPELAITLAVLSLVLALALPGFNRALESVRVDGGFHAITASFATARIAAVSQRKAVAVCPSRDGRECRKDLVWEDGWIVFLDRSRKGTPSSAKDIVRHVDRIQRGLTVRSSAGRHLVRYQPSGLSSGTNLTLRICSRATGLELGEVIVNNGGRARSIRRPGGVACPYAQ